MNKWFRRAVGTVGIAGGMLLLGAGTANADDAALTPGLLDDLFSPTGGRLALPPNAPDTAENLALHSLPEAGEPQDAVRIGEILGALPISSVLPASGLGLPTGNSMPVLDPTQDIATVGVPGARLVQGASSNNAAAGTEAGGVGGTGLPVNAQTPTLDQVISGRAPLGGSLLDGGSPVQGNLVPVGGLPAIPIGRGHSLLGSLVPANGLTPGSDLGEDAEAGGLPLLGIPVSGDLLSNVMQDNTVQGMPGGLPVAGGLPIAGGLPVAGGLPAQRAVEGLPVVSQALPGYQPRHAAPRHAAEARHAATTQNAMGARHAREGFGTALDAEDVTREASPPLVGLLPGGGKVPAVAPLGGGQGAADLPVLGNLLSKGANSLGASPLASGPSLGGGSPLAGVSQLASGSPLGGGSPLAGVSQLASGSPLGGGSPLAGVSQLASGSPLSALPLGTRPGAAKPSPTKPSPTKPSPTRPSPTRSTNPMGATGTQPSGAAIQGIGPADQIG
jgi:hypothetical protein